MKAWSRRLPRLRRSRSHDLPGISATARLDRRTKNLTKRLQPGDIAIIDHADLDRVSAEALIRRRVAAVVNASPGISGRYPNLGAKLLVEALIPVVDDVGTDVFEQVADGQPVRLDGETLYLGNEIVAKGTVQDCESVAAAMEDAKVGIADQLKAFASNTIEYISRDSELLIDGIRVPELRTDVEGRHVLVVARGYRHRDDLQAVLLADEMGATLIVAVGMRFSMAEFLDKGRSGMASAVLTRMRVGDKIVDAKGVSRLYRSRISGWALFTLVLAAFVAIVAAASISEPTKVFVGFLLAQWDAFRFWLTGLL